MPIGLPCTILPGVRRCIHGTHAAAGADDRCTREGFPIDSTALRVHMVQTESSVRSLRTSGAHTEGYALGDRSKALLSGVGVTTVL